MHTHMPPQSLPPPTTPKNLLYLTPHIHINRNITTNIQAIVLLCTLHAKLEIDQWVDAGHLTVFRMVKIKYLFCNGWQVNEKN